MTTRPAPAPTDAGQAYEALVRAGALDVVRLAADGWLLADLPGWRTLTGRPRDLHGYEWLEDVHPDDRTELRRQGAGVHRAGVPLDLSFRIRAARCGERVLRAQLVGIADGAGALAGWVGRLDDVTEVVAHDARIRRTAAAVTALALTVTVEDVVRCVEEVLLGLVGARACAVYVEPGPGAPGTPYQPLMVSRAYRGPVDALLDASAPTDGPGEPGLVLPLTVGGARPGSWHLLGLDDGALASGSP
jgi:hypothetical protein